MSLNETVSSERLHIGFFGLRNAGKSSLVNAVTGQELAVVSAVSGTTTDPVKKAMELLPLGPVVMIDTPGLDDEGELGALRVQRTQRILAQTDIAVVVVDAAAGVSALDEQLLAQLKERGVAHILAYNKADKVQQRRHLPENALYVSALTGENIDLLKEKLGALPLPARGKRVVGDLLSPGDTVVLVVPIDAAAPKGRLILPQQLAMRDILDSGCSCVVCRDSELKETLGQLRTEPKMVITDAKVFAKVDKLVEQHIPLTSFSMLMARYKGELSQLVQGAERIDRLNGAERVLICEGCTHHRQCGDIGTVRLPQWLQARSGAALSFDFTSGGDFPEDVSRYALIVHCGGCMLSEKEMANRMRIAQRCGVPMVNYGVAIAHCNGVLRRALAPFGCELENG